jgi:hypothetical protein
MVKNSDRLTVTVTAPQQKFLEEKKIIEEPKSTDSSDSTTPKFPTTGYPPR